MAIQYNDGRLSELMDFDKALTMFLQDPNASSLHKFQTESEFSTFKAESDLKQRVSNLEARLKEMQYENVLSDVIHIPSEYEMTNLGIVINPNKNRYRSAITLRRGKG